MPVFCVLGKRGKLIAERCRSHAALQSEFWLILVLTSHVWSVRADSADWEPAAGSCFRSWSIPAILRTKKRGAGQWQVPEERNALKTFLTEMPVFQVLLGPISGFFLCKHMYSTHSKQMRTGYCLPCPADLESVLNRTFSNTCYFSFH